MSLGFDEKYDVFARRDRRFAGQFYACVKTTGIFCRPGCPARMPKPENVEFRDTVEQCLSAGYRACKRCHPSGDTPKTVRQLISLVEDHPDLRWSEVELQKRGISPSTARRAFLAHFGMSFLDYARQRRLARAAHNIKQGDRVLDSQLNAGYESASGFAAAFAKTFGTTPKGGPKGGAGTPLSIDWFDTPMGRMVCIADDVALYMLEFVERKHMTRQMEKLRRVHKRAVVPGQTVITRETAIQLGEYYAGERATFDLPLAPTGTEFQNRTWEALLQIPHGQTRSYAQLAEMVGNPAAVRAVAGANSKNGLAVVIPCHRVIAKDGGLGGYAGGVSRKAKLLDLEKDPNK